jgi:hypothetical protein
MHQANQTKFDDYPDAAGHTCGDPQGQQKRSMHADDDRDWSEWRRRPNRQGNCTCDRSHSGQRGKRFDVRIERPTRRMQRRRDHPPAPRFDGVLVIARHAISGSETISSNSMACNRSRLDTAERDAGQHDGGKPTAERRWNLPRPTVRPSTPGIRSHLHAHAAYSEHNVRYDDDCNRHPNVARADTPPRPARIAESHRPATGAIRTDCTM